LHVLGLLYTYRGLDIPLNDTESAPQNIAKYRWN